MGGGGAGPTIRMTSTGTHGAGGVACCFCRCCTCIHIEFLKTLPGMVKVAEALISSLIQYLLINYGLRYSATIGSAYESALTTCSACFLNSAVLLVCYIVSEKSYRLIRSSLFELMFNALASFLYLSSASYLAFATKMFLWGQYLLTPGFDVYPAMSAAYMLCGVVGVLHGADAYYSYKHYTGGVSSTEKIDIMIQQMSMTTMIPTSGSTLNKIRTAIIFFEMMLGIICCAILGRDLTNPFTIKLIAGIVFFIISFAFTLSSFILLISHLVSSDAGLSISKSPHDVIYHSVGFFFLIAGSIAFFAELFRYEDLLDLRNVGHNRSTEISFNYNALLATGIVGLINSALYFWSIFLALKSYRTI